MRAMGILYLVATPIGNLEDITARALRTLREVSLVAAEDTRTARNLLSHFQIVKPITSYFEHNKLSKLNTILDALAHGDVAVISEAGLPGLSDPGYELVRAAIERGIRVVPIPGVSALTTALVASGLPTDQFVYVGFLPRQKNARRKLLQSIVDEPRTIVAYEAPHRLRESLDDILAVLGDRAICVARELTKLHEEFFRGSVTQAQAHFEANAPRGEFTLVIAGTTADEQPPVAEEEQWDDARVIATVNELIASGVARTEAVKRIAHEANRDRRAVYQLTLGNDE
jgi:16S rRNA (cytidine1402-2'-O)-methyltransferase